MVFFTFRPLYSKQRDPGTHLVKDRVVPRAGMDVLEMRKSLAVTGNGTILQ
jgi:hypothetical protein